MYVKFTANYEVTDFFERQCRQGLKPMLDWQSRCAIVFHCARCRLALTLTQQLNSYRELQAKNHINIQRLMIFLQNIFIDWNLSTLSHTLTCVVTVYHVHTADNCHESTNLPKLLNQKVIGIRTLWSTQMSYKSLRAVTALLRSWTCAYTVNTGMR